MNKTRLEAFSDGVIAIIITIMVLELKVPHGNSIQALLEMWPIFMSYVLSFIYVGIYWNNHHHLFQVVEQINGATLWANLHLLFWLSLIPFVTAWAGENHFSSIPVAVYGVVLLMAGISYTILYRVLAGVHGKQSLLFKAIGKDHKGIVSLIIYVIAIIVACNAPALAGILYVVVAFLWLIPDRRIEKVLRRP